MTEIKESTCDCCGRPWSELPEFNAEVPINFGKDGYKKINTRILKTYRREYEDDDGFVVGSSWECIDCLGLTIEEYWDRRNKLPRDNGDKLIIELKDWLQKVERRNKYISLVEEEK